MTFTDPTKALMELTQGPAAFNEGLFTGSLEGFVSGAARARRLKRYESAFAEATSMWLGLREGHIDPMIMRAALNPGRASSFACEYLGRHFPSIFHENMGLADFPQLTSDILDQSVYGAYAQYPATWTDICRVVTLNDLRTVKRHIINGAEQPWEPVGEAAPHLRQRIVQGSYTYQPYKYASGAEPISWEAVVNDYLDIFRDLPQRVANGGWRAKSKFVTQLYIGASGPDSTLYSVGNANIIASNPVLSISSLGTGITQLRKRVDVGGDPITILGKIILRIGPDLEVTATNLINTLVARIKESGGVSNQELEVSNWLVRNITVSVDPYLPIVASSANGTTTWALFADPRAQNRPALELGEMRGFERPIILEKAGNTMRGGSVDQSMGDWDTMSREIKGMEVFGGAQIDPKSTVASNGSGS